MNQQAETKMIRARVQLIVKHPFFGELTLRMPIKEDESLNPPTLATDGRRLYYHPDWVLGNDDDIVMAGAAHEVVHMMMQHIGRRNGREPQRWNVAVDHATNLILKDAKFSIGQGWYCDAQYAGMSAEEIYAKLPPSKKGDKPSFDSHSDQPLTAKEVLDFEMAMISAVKSHDDAPGFVKRHVAQITAPKNDWRGVMSRFATEAARDDYSWQRFNKKFVPSGYFLPGLYSQAMGELAAAIDTSGSIDEKTLNMFGAHLNEIKSQVHPLKTHIIYCDARVNHVDEFDQYDDLTFAAHGGGGTAFAPAFDHVAEHGIQPKCFMYLTDGYGPFPAAPPPYPVLWLMTTDVQPPWGEVVRIEV